jgi:glycosyltransferase involved in cell wall biosynthesis
MTAILLSHPHSNTVAKGTALALARAGVLSAYATGVVAAEGTLAAALMRRAGRFLPIARNRILDGIDPALVRSLAPIELSARLAAQLARPGGFSRPPSYDAVFTAHDVAVSLMPWPRATDTVYAYEDAALLTFKRAAKRDIERVWDLPLPHYATLETMWIEEARRWPGAMGESPRVEPEWKKRRKDEEMALANRIAVPSLYTAESVRATGSDAPVITIPFGFPVHEFAAKPETGEDERRPFTVIAVGTHDLRKGTPYLLEAWRAAGLKDAKLRLVGPMKLTQPFIAKYAGLFEHVPHVPRAELEREYHAADLLALPTLGDGCPQVMQEAMCCATPVVTTRCGSGPDLITHGEDGWLVPERDIEALVALFRSLAPDRDRARAAGRAARRRAEGWTWEHAGAAIAAALSSNTR